MDRKTIQSYIKQTQALKNAKKKAVYLPEEIIDELKRITKNYQSNIQTILLMSCLHFITQGENEYMSNKQKRDELKEELKRELREEIIDELRQSTQEEINRCMSIISSMDKGRGVNNYGTNNITEFT